MNKRDLSERDICSKFITPALVSAKWDLMSQIREEVSFTKGPVIVRRKLSTRGEPKRADYILYHKLARGAEFWAAGSRPKRCIAHESMSPRYDE